MNYRSLLRPLLLSILLLTTVAARAVSPDVVISQVYGGGGNAGATYKNDFIELYNRGSAPVSLSGWSVQYASSTGSSWQVTTLSGSIQPGGYYLVQESQGAGGTTNLPTPDATGTIAMSATAAKVALVHATTALSGTCPTANVVDLVGFGAANCFEGSGPVAALTNTTAALRANGGATDTDSNAADFATGAPNPRNGAPPTTNPTGAGSATPANGDLGDSIVLKVVVTPGSNPVSSSLTVTADLSAIGGSATQSFTGDSNNNFTFTAVVGNGSTPGAKALPFTVADSQLRHTSGSIAFSVNQPPPPVVAIHTIQGESAPSAYVGQMVSVVGIVTAQRSNGFFLQTPDSATDADPWTSEAIFVFTSSAPPSQAAVGNQVQVSGLVSEFQPSGSRLTVTELGAPLSYKLLSTGNALPAPVTVTASDDDPAGSFAQLSKYEAMRVHFDSLTAVSGTGGTLSEANATSTSNGTFWAVVTGVARPFREPGLDVNSVVRPLAPPNTPLYDGNPERIRVNTAGQVGATKYDVTSNAVIAGVTGVLDYASDAYTVLPDPGPLPAISNMMSAVAVSQAGDREFTIASFNMERFYNDVKDPSPDSGAVTLTSAAFQLRLTKASLAIRNVLNMPDLIGIEEMENQATLDRVAAQVNSDAVSTGQPNPNYVGCTYQGNDPSAIDVAVLVKTARVNMTSCTQIGKDDTFIDPSDGSVDTLHDRPPLVVMATIQPPKGQPFPVTLVVNHLKALTGAEDATSNGVRVRAKRRFQAEAVARLLAEHQAAGENVVTVGDFNSFEFNDGLTDVIGTVIGNPAPADQVIQASDDYIDPNLTDLLLSLPANMRYTYSENGSAQVLDHIIVDNALLVRPVRLEVAHNDADFPLVYQNDASRPERISDHDMPVAFFTFPPPQADLAVSITADAAPLLTGHAASFSFTVTNLGPDAADQLSLMESIPAATSLNVTAPAGWSCSTTGALQCTADTLAAGATATFQVTMTPACAMANGTDLATSINVTSSTDDPNGANNAATQHWTASNPAPVVSDVVLSKSVLTAVNHKLVTIGLSYSVSDNCDAAIAPLVTVTSNQPIDGIGDGHTTYDYAVLDSHTVQVRAERAGTSADDRVYTITVTATDSAGQSTSRSAQVTVPHNQ